jgi:hypothetical protein
MSARTSQLVYTGKELATHGGGRYGPRANRSSSQDSTHRVDLGRRRGELGRDVHGDSVTVTRGRLAKLQGWMRKSSALRDGHDGR